MAFQKGISGNPSGRPRGIKDRRVAIGEKYRKLILRKLMELVKQGDVRAIQIAADRFLPKLKSEFEKVNLPKFKNAKDYADEIMAEVADGTIAPNVARDLLELATQQVSLTEIETIMQRIEELESGGFNPLVKKSGPEIPSIVDTTKRKKVRIRRVRFSDE